MFQRILVPVDGSQPSNDALSTACELAKGQGGQLQLVYVLDPSAYWTGYDPTGAAAGYVLQAMQDSGRRILEDAAASARDAGVSAETVLIDGLRAGGRLGESISEAAKSWAADLIVVGTHGRRGPSRLLLGSGAEEIIRLSPVPVLVMRSSSGT